MENQPTPEQLDFAPRAIRVLEVIACDRFAMSIDDVTKQRWSDVMELMRITDSRADTESADRILSLATTLEEFSTLYPSLSVSELGGDRYAALIENAAGIIRHGELLRRAATADAYTHERFEEAVKTARVITLLATDSVQTHPNFRDKFVPLVEKLAIGAGYIDTAQDAKRDFQEGTLQINPTLHFRAHLMKKGLIELVQVLPDILSPRVIRSFGKLAIDAHKSHKIRDKNRLY